MRARLGVVLSQAGEDVGVPLLPAERLHRPDPAERLHEMHDDQRDGFPGPPVGARGLAPEPGRQAGQRDEAGQHHQAEPPVEQEHAGADKQQGQDGRDQRVEPFLEQVGDRLDVGGLPGDDAPGGVVLVERHLQAEEVREQAATQLKHHLLANLPGHGDEHAGGDRLRPDRDEERGRDAEQRRRVMGVQQRRQAGVDGDADQPRPGQRGQARHHDQRDGGDDRAPVRAQ